MSLKPPFGRRPIGSSSTKRESLFSRGGHWSITCRTRIGRTSHFRWFPAHPFHSFRIYSNHYINGGRLSECPRIFPLIHTCRCLLWVQCHLESVGVWRG